MQICLVVFAQLLTDKQTDKQTNNDENNLIGAGNKNKSGMQCINKCSAVAADEMGDRFATIDMRRKEGAAVTLSGGGGWVSI